MVKIIIVKLDNFRKPMHLSYFLRAEACSCKYSPL
jgi:hypothetical protein